MPTVGVSNAEFNRHIEFMNAEFLGGPALVRTLGDDLGALDAQGRPQVPCTLWWFIAHLDPTSTKVTAQREQLTTFLKRGNLGRDEVVRLAFALIGDARAALGDATAAARVDEFGGVEARTYPAGRAALAKLLAAAEDGVRAWAADPGYRGSSFFVARPSPGQEFVSTRSPRGQARLYATEDDERVAQWPRDTVLALGEPRGPSAPTTRPARPAPAPSAPATPAPSKLQGMTQADAVKAVLAGNVLENAGAGVLDAEFVKELHADAVETVAERAGAAERQKKLLGRGTAGFAADYRDKDAQAARAQAQAVLQQLGVGLGDVRAYRNRVADALGAATAAGGALPGGAPVAKGDYRERVGELERLANAIDSAGRVTMDDVAALQRFVDGTDLATIYDADPSLQELFQNEIFSVWKTIGPPDPEFKALETLYYFALDENKRLKAERAAAGGHLSYDEVQGKVRDILKRTSFDNPPTEATFEAVAALARRLPPDAKHSEAEDVGGCAVSIGAFAWQTNPALHQKFLALLTELRERFPG